MLPPLPSVSVIVITRDRPELLADALRGVQVQTVAPLEVRVADDGEQPVHDAIDAAGLLEVCVLRCDGRRVARARNLAARGARGEVLAFLDDDDRWLPDHLSGLAHAFRDPSLQVAWRDAVVVRERLEDGRRVDLERRTIAHDWDAGWMRHDDFVPPSSWGVRRGFFERLGGFDERYGCSEDWDFLLRAARATRPRRVAGATVEVRMRDRGHASDHDAPGRRAALDLLSASHGLEPLAIRTFWDVAGLLEPPK
jgi:glycosyltransferase involved in cell wall biosynthesis